MKKRWNVNENDCVSFWEYGSDRVYRYTNIWTRKLTMGQSEKVKVKNGAIFDSLPRPWNTLLLPHHILHLESTSAYLFYFFFSIKSNLVILLVPFWTPISLNIRIQCKCWCESYAAGLRMMKIFRLVDIFEQQIQKRKEIPRVIHFLSLI